MDIPIDLLQWEVFSPRTIQGEDFGGDAIRANLLPPASRDVSGAESESDITGIPGAPPVINYETVALLPGQLGGILVDSSGAVIAKRGSDSQSGGTRNGSGSDHRFRGRWIVSNLPSGPVRITASAPGYKQLVGQFT